MMIWFACAVITGRDQVIARQGLFRYRVVLEGPDILLA
jgi:hypothetical protein